MLKRLWQLIFPPRAATGTWMFLTFALFVGMAVVGVGLYVGFVLRVQIEEAVHETLAQQAERVATLIEQADTSLDKRQVVSEFSRLTTFRVSVASEDSVLYNADGDEFIADGTLLLPAEMVAIPQGRAQFYEEQEGDERMVYITLYRPTTGLVVRIGQPEPLLVRLVYNMQWTVVLGMVMAFLLALVGSWIAAQKVTGPLQTINDSARNISQGEFDEKIRVNTRAAEIQDLAKSLNRMSDRFREKIDELERVTRLQSEFIGNVSHEVRNPVFAISGYMEALGSSSLSDEQRKRYSEKGLLNLQRLQNLFSDLIEIARLEFREDLIKASVFDLQELIDEVGDMLRPKAQEKGINLVLENQTYMVEADRSRIRQVLTNLIENAIAYSDEGTVRCRIRRRLEKVRVEVVDTGKGIPEEHLDRIFERFYRVDPGRSRKSGGTGLGLSIVKQIMQAHGETMHVESTLGRGTRFWFDLPYAGKTAEVEATE